MLLLSSDQRIAERLVSYIGEWQSWGLGFDRILESNMIVPNRMMLSSIMPFKIEEFNFHDIEGICQIHYFDMFIAYNLSENQSSGQLADIYLDGYEYTTTQWPQRSIVDKYMYDMLEKNGQ